MAMSHLSPLAEQCLVHPRFKSQVQQFAARTSKPAEQICLLLLCVAMAFVMVCKLLQLLLHVEAVVMTNLTWGYSLLPWKQMILTCSVAQPLCCLLSRTFFSKLLGDRVKVVDGLA